MSGPGAYCVDLKVVETLVRVGIWPVLGCVLVSIRGGGQP
jgi:hypothetical protein